MLAASPKHQIPRHTHRFTLFSSDGDFYYSTFAIRSLFKCGIQVVQLQVTLCINHRIHPCHSSCSQLLSLPASCWAFEPHRPCLWSHASPAQGLDSLPGCHSKLRIRQLWFPSRCQGWTCVRVRICSFLLNWYTGALQCYAVLTCGASHGGSRG